MLTGIKCLLVTCLVATTAAIRVDWNTNTGPIIPPTPRSTVRPIPPFREPAPVWEDLSNDIPNPNPYIYVPPPPSRPKQRLNTNVNYKPNDENKNINYGSLVTAQPLNPYYQQQHQPQTQHVAALSPQYIPNVGIRYVAVIPSAAKTAGTATTKYPVATTNALSPNDIVSDGYKLQGKYNAKTKKYKAYEKVKYVPQHNYHSLIKDSDSKVEASSKRNVPASIPVWADDHGQDVSNDGGTPMFKRSSSSNKSPDNETTSHTTAATSIALTTRSTNTATGQATSSMSKLSTKPFKFYSKNVYVKDPTPKSKLTKKS